ncbi:(d)CMP kinase [Euzebya tangerina]|uniref:(d)CMP kinase n=1 Tax=Euzebya tangerina TaxID=591198 RepID=UPI000E318494|nr:(d)CMP kinase [Euzebya tangerina]
MSRPPVVAIDGPAGSGKSTAAKALADRLGVPHIDTGAYYRAAALAVMRAGVDPQTASADAISDIVRAVSIDRMGGRTLLDGQDVEAEIRGEAVTAHVSAVARVQSVRDQLLAAQQAGIERDGGVIEGRDAATRVAPTADVKVWLDADVEERARRRASQAGEADRVDFHADDLARRDSADAAQMEVAADAIVLDTTRMAPDEVVDAVVELVTARR